MTADTMLTEPHDPTPELRHIDDGRDLAVTARLATAATRGVPLLRGMPRAFLVPDGYALEVAEPVYREVPRRIVGDVQLADHDSFSSYVLEHGAGRAHIYADVDRLAVDAVLNDDTDGEPGWRDHRVNLTLRKTPEWKSWTASSGKNFDQVEFSEFLEQHAHDIVSPDAATMIDVARTFQARRDVEFASAVSQQDGSVQLTYNETIDGKVGRGRMEVPDTFTILVAPFYGAEPVSVVARFRYRLRQGTLGLGYALLHTDRIVRQAFEAVTADITAQTGIVVLNGQPPVPRTDDGER